MTDFELESKLKNIPLPERSQDYWENFPAQLRAQIRGAGILPARQAGSLLHNFWPRLAWSSAIAFAGFIFVLTLLPAFHVALKNERIVRRELAQLPNHLRVFMADEHGMHYLIADQQ